MKHPTFSLKKCIFINYRFKNKVYTRKVLAEGGVYILLNILLTYIIRRRNNILPFKKEQLPTRLKQFNIEIEFTYKNSSTNT